MDPTDDVVDVPLTLQELELLARGLGEWSGPACCTEGFAVAMGFESLEDFLAQSRRVQGALILRKPLSAIDWLRTLLATEIAFASDVVGSGLIGLPPRGSPTNTPSKCSEQSSARSSPRQPAYARAGSERYTLPPRSSGRGGRL